MVNWVIPDRERLVDKSMYKIANNMVSDYLSSHLVFRSDTLTYNLRESDCSLAIPQPPALIIVIEACLTAGLYCGIVYP